MSSQKKTARLNLIQWHAGKLVNHELVYSLRTASLTVRGLSLTDIYPPAYKRFYMRGSLLCLITVWPGGKAMEGQ